MTSQSARPDRAHWIGVVLSSAAVLILGAGCSSPSSELASEDVAEAESPGHGVGLDEDGTGAAVLDVAGQTAVTRPMVEIPSEWDSEIDELYGRYWLYWEAYAAAFGPPNVDPAYGPLRVLSTDVNWETLREQLQTFVEDGVILALPEGSITEHMLRIPNASVLSDDEGSEVILQDCWIDDFVQQTVDGKVLTRTREAKLMNVSMKVVAGQWRVDGVTEATPESDGYEQCEELL